MIKALENLGNAISSDSDFTDEDELSQNNVSQWVGVISAVAHNTDIKQAVDAVDVGAFGSDIVKLIGSLRNEDVVKHMSQKIDWSNLFHNNQSPTTQRSDYHENSFRNRVLANLTERSFWIRQFGTDQCDDDTFDNIAFVFHTLVKQDAISFDHLVPSELFQNPVRFGTAVLAHQLGERFYIFENTPFDNIDLKHQADFFVAGCLHMGAREDHLDPEERTLGEGRLSQLLNTMANIDVNQPYAVSDYLCQTFGWSRGTTCPLGVVGLSILAATPIHSKYSTSFAVQTLNLLTPQNKEISFSLLRDALIHTTSWETVRGEEDFGSINSTIVQHLIEQNPCVVKKELLEAFEQNQWSVEHKNIFRCFMIEASKTPNRVFSLEDAPAFLKGCLQLFDVRQSNDGWGAQKIWNQWWHGSFHQSLKWFDQESEQKIITFMKPYLIAMAGVSVSCRDDDERMQCKLVLETLNPNHVCLEHTPRKLKM